MGAFSFDVPTSTFREFITVATGGLASFLLPGDFDSDEALTGNDIDLLSIAVRNESETKFELNRDRKLDQFDRETWVRDYARTWFGDANLDGEFGTSDLVAVFEAGEYEDAVSLNSTWSTGDWNGDREFTTSDLVTAFEDGGYEQGPLTDIDSVPEPYSALLI